jgi:Glycine cleavage system protein P (pyridoxal-binding), N-terminal domain
MPPRIIRASKNTSSNLSYRLSLQTKEQHIRKKKTTSNISTSQTLLPIITNFFTIYHSPNLLKGIANDVHP